MFQKSGKNKSVKVHDQMPPTETVDVENKSQHHNVYILTLGLMILCGSSNDFLGKLIYQMYPENGVGLEGLRNDYWIAWFLTAGSFFICSFAILSKSSYSSFNILKKDKQLFFKLCIPSIMDLLVTGGRYIGLLFLSAASISILKNGSQLVFLALLSRFVHHKALRIDEFLGIMITIVGLIIVALEDIAFTNDPHSHTNTNEALIGIGILVTVGLLGAVRNDLEEILLKKYELSSNFVVGVESIISLQFTILVGFCIFLLDPFGNIGNVFQKMHNDLLVVPEISICFVLFFAAIFGKDTSQMKMTALSSALTRKLYQQVYPSGTWVLSLVGFQISNEKYGEAWIVPYSVIKVAGFIVVFVGNYLYIRRDKCILCKRKYDTSQSTTSGSTTWICTEETNGEDAETENLV